MHKVTSSTIYACVFVCMVLPDMEMGDFYFDHTMLFYVAQKGEEQ